MIEVETKAVDLADYDPKVACEKSVEIELVHPQTEEGVGVFISIIGRESEAFQKAVNAKINHSLKLQAINKNKPQIVTVEGNEDEAAELLAQCTTGWRSVGSPPNTIVYGGVNYGFSQSNAKLIYGKSRWIRNQVDKAVGDLSLFFPN